MLAEEELSTLDVTPRIDDFESELSVSSNDGENAASIELENNEENAHNALNLPKKKKRRLSKKRTESKE